jgi:hypothetical protein
VVRTEKRFTVDGLANLRVLMDALLPKVFDGGLQGDGTFTGQPENGILRPGRQSAVGAREGDVGAAGSGQISSVRWQQIRCLNPQTLAVARGDREVVRKRMDRYYHRGSLPVPRMKIFRIPNTVQAPGTRRSVTLHVSLWRSDGDSEGILSHDAAVILEGTPRHGKGSHPREAKA